MSKIKQLVSEDLELYDNSTDENGLYPGEARATLIDAVEFDKAQREFELSKYSKDELTAELMRRMIEAERQ